MNIQDCDGNTALLIAALNEYTSVFEQLLKKSDSDVARKWSSFTESNVTDLNIKNNAKESCLHICVKETNLEMIELILMWSDLNITDSNKNCSYYAFKNNSMDIFELLLQNKPMSTSKYINHFLGSPMTAQV